MCQNTTGGFVVQLRFLPRLAAGFGWPLLFMRNSFEKTVAYTLFTIIGILFFIFMKFLMETIVSILVFILGAVYALWGIVDLIR